MAVCTFISRDESSQEKLQLANFTHGRLQRNPDGTWKKAPSFTLLRSSETDDSRKNLRRILVAEADSMQYVGQNYGEQASKANTMCKYMVGVLDKKRGKMKVLDAQLFDLRPWFGKKEDEEEQDETKTKELTYGEKQDRLTEAFGSSRKQRAMESRHRSQVASEALESSAAKAVTHAGVSPGTPIKFEMDDDDLLPPCDKTATRPEDVYKLDDLISPRHQEVLMPLAEELIEGAEMKVDEWKKSSMYPKYVMDHLPALARCPKLWRISQATCLLYITFLMQLYIVKPKELKNKSFLKDAPVVIKNHLLETFTQMTPTPDGRNEKRFLPKRMKDKILCYILVLAQLIDSFHTDLVPLSQDLDLSIKSLVTHARVIGCKSYSQTTGSGKKSKSRGGKRLLDDGGDDDGADVQKATFIELSAPIKTQQSPSMRKFSRKK